MGYERSFMMFLHCTGKFNHFRQYSKHSKNSSHRKNFLKEMTFKLIECQKQINSMRENKDDTFSQMEWISDETSFEISRSSEHISEDKG